MNDYKKIALQFSGGKDSLACLYLLKDKIDDIAVYWCDTGDACPETVSVINEVRKWIPNFIEIRTDSKEWRKHNGIPSDLIPSNSHFLGKAYGMSDVMISNKFDCCFNNLMLPMHNKMVEDGVDLVIRGTKLSDSGKIPADGKTEFYDIYLPLKNWSHDDVFKYLKSVGAPKNKIYENFRGISAPECLTCSAWWDDNKKSYLRSYHPEEYKQYLRNIRIIAANINKHLADMESELAVDLEVAYE